jgi:hypothetical protein
MRVAMVATGMVEDTVATKLVQPGHEGCLGSRQADNEKGVAWAARARQNASHGTLADAAAFGGLM